MQEKQTNWSEEKQRQNSHSNPGTLQTHLAVNNLASGDLANAPGDLANAPGDLANMSGDLVNAPGDLAYVLNFRFAPVPTETGEVAGPKVVDGEDGTALPPPPLPLQVPPPPT
jgi:hypothetical protein